MGKLKDRLVTEVTADLVRWSRTDNFTFQGIVWASTDERWIDGNPMTIRFTDIQYYPTVRAFWEEHWIGRTLEGNYFRMEKKHELRMSHRD